MIVLTEISSPVQFNISSSTGYSYIGTTTANAATFVSIPSSFQVQESTYTDRHLGLHVTSSPSEPISVVMIGHTSTPRSTYLALPCHDQPTEEYIYYGISHESSENNRYSQILIVGCRDNTTVTITPTQTIQLPQDPQQTNSAMVTITAGTSHTVTIHALQTLLIAAEFVDLTGTKVLSNYPLTVIGGHDCTTVPVSYLDCDPIATQSPPTINWGTQFLLIPLQSRNNGQMVKVMSSENSTNVVIRCSDQSLHSNLAIAGNFISYYVGSLHYCHILCSQPCYVAEFAFGREYNSYIWDSYGDPLIMTVPSIRQYIHSVTFTTLPEMPTNFFGIVVPADSYFNGTVLINDVLTTYDWTIIYNINGTISGYGYTTTANGNYTISHSHPNGKIYVSVYGFSHYGGYGYPAGMLLDSLEVSRNSTQDVNRSSMLSIYQTNCLPMTQSTTIITITTTNQMTLTHMYHVTSDTTPVHSTLTVKDTCTETITTTTVIASILGTITTATVTTNIVGSPLSCDYSTVLAQTSTITMYSEPSSFSTNVPVTTVTCPSIAPYTISKITPCECRSTPVTSSVTSYVIKSTSCTETVTYTSTSTSTFTNIFSAFQSMSSCYISTVFIPVPTNTLCPDMTSVSSSSTTLATDNLTYSILKTTPLESIKPTELPNCTYITMTTIIDSNIETSVGNTPSQKSLLQMVSTVISSTTSDCVCSTAASDSYVSYNVMSSSYTVTVTHTNTSTTMLTNTITASPNMPICQTSTVFIPASSNTRCPDVIPSTATSTTVATEKNDSSYKIGQKPSSLYSSLQIELSVTTELPNCSTITSIIRYEKENHSTSPIKLFSNIILSSTIPSSLARTSYEKMHTSLAQTSTIISLTTTTLFTCTGVAKTMEVVSSCDCSATCVTSSIFPAITTIDHTNKQPSNTRATVITKGKGILTTPQIGISTSISSNNIVILRPTKNLQTGTASNIMDTEYIVLTMVLLILISIIVCVVASILSYIVGVSRGKRQANDGYERMHHPEQDADVVYENPDLNLLNPHNYENQPNLPNDQNLPNPPNDQNQPNPPNYQNLPNPPNDQNLFNQPNYQHRLNPHNDQNLPDPPNYQNRRNPPNYQNLPDPPNDQNRLIPPNFLNLPNPHNDQNLPDPPNYQNRPNQPNYPNLPDPSNYQNLPDPSNDQNRLNPHNNQNRLNPPNDQNQPNYQNLPNPPNDQNLFNQPNYQYRLNPCNDQNLPDPPNYQNQSNPPNYQNRLNPPNDQNQPNPPNYQNLPNPPNDQNLFNQPNYQNRLHPRNDQNLPNPPNYQNLPNPSNYQNLPDPSNYQNLPDPSNDQNRLNPPNYQNRLNPPNDQNQPNYQNLPNPPNYQNLPNPPNYQNRLNPPNDQNQSGPPNYQNLHNVQYLPNPDNQQSLYTPLVTNTMENPSSNYTSVYQSLSPEWRETSFYS